MPKTIPTTVVLPNVAEAQPGEDVLLSTYEASAELLHYVYARQGAICPGPVYDEPWTSLDFSLGGDVYHTENQATPLGFENLDAWQGLFRFRRPFYDSVGAASAYTVRLDAYAKNLDLRATLVRLDTADGHSGTSTAFTSLQTSHASADSEWQFDTLTFTPAQASRSGATVNGLAYFLVYVEAKVPAAGNGRLWTFAVRETTLTAGTNLPRGA